MSFSPHPCRLYYIYLQTDYFRQQSLNTRESMCIINVFANLRCSRSEGLDT